LPDILERVVSSLEWHGALSLDMILSESGPVVIDVNPRLVEPANAFFSGVDLVGAMLELTASDKTQVQPVSRLGVRSHQSLLAILGTAAQTGSRRAILREAMDAFLFARAVLQIKRGTDPDCRRCNRSRSGVGCAVGNDPPSRTLAEVPCGDRWQLFTYGAGLEGYPHLRWFLIGLPRLQP
ncbi:hypothetical protein B2A_07342, partial [mine drainage metagenome]